MMNRVDMWKDYRYGVTYIDHAIEGSPKCSDSFTGEYLFGEMAKDETTVILTVYDNRTGEIYNWR